MSAAHTPGPWHISASDTGVHLMHNNYCVTRLDGRDPRKITDALNPHLVPHDDPAPQLAEALRAILAESDTITCGQRMSGAFEHARAALTAAGVTP